MTTITIAHGAINAKLVNPSPKDKAIVQEILSYKPDGANWSGLSSFFSYSDATFPAGFVIKVFRALKARGYTVNLVRKPLPAPLGPVRPEVDKFGKVARYDYQDDIPELLCKYGQIIARVATGGGKSRISKLCFNKIGRPTLFLTTRGILMHQMKDSFIRDMKLPVGVFGDDEWTDLQLINVGMVQSFAARLADPAKGDSAEKRAAQRMRQEQTVLLLEKFEVLILEEAHEASSDSYYLITRLCRNAHYRLALTGTPFMKDSEVANLQLEAASGPVAIRVSEEMLIDRGILAKPYFKFVDLGDKPVEGFFIDEKGKERIAKLYNGTPYQKAYEIGVVGNPARNKAIVDEVSRARKFGLTSLVLVSHKAHGRRLLAMLKEAGVRAEFIEGENNQEQRKAALQSLGYGSIDCLIGSTILDVGVDVPSVGLVVLAGAGKAEVAVRQRIGRGLREKKSGPNVCFVLDFIDKQNSHLRLHARERRGIIDTTPGFAQGVVLDFPYEDIFGAK